MIRTAERCWCGECGDLATILCEYRDIASTRRPTAAPTEPVVFGTFNRPCRLVGRSDDAACPASGRHAECAPASPPLPLPTAFPASNSMQSNFKRAGSCAFPGRWRAPLPSPVRVSERGCIPFLMNERCTSPLFPPPPPPPSREGVKIRGYGLRPTRDCRRPCLTGDIEMRLLCQRTR